MKRMIQFQLTITVEGVPYKAGDEVDAADVPAGCLEGMRRLGQCKDVTPPKVAAAQAKK